MRRTLALLPRGARYPLLLFCLATARPSAAQAPPLTLEQVLERALEQNPDMIAARLQVDMAGAEQRIARALPNPSYASEPGQPFQYSLTQALDFGPQRLYRTRTARYGARAASYDQADVRRQVTFDVRQAFYDLLLAESLRGVAAEEREIFRQLLATDSLRLRSGDVAERDLTKAELELARADAQLARAGSAVLGARLGLQALMGVAHPDTAFRVQGELRFRPVAVPPDSLLLRQSAARPDLLATEQRVVQGRAAESLVRAELLPLPQLSAVYQPGGPFDSGRRYALGLSFTVPVLSQYGGERDRERAATSLARVAQTRVQTQIASEVGRALADHLASRGLAERYETGLLARASGELETARYAYGSGAISLLELLEAIRTNSETKSNYYNAVHDYWVSLYALSHATGGEIIQ